MHWSTSSGLRRSPSLRTIHFHAVSELKDGAEVECEDIEWIGERPTFEVQLKIIYVEGEYVDYVPWECKDENPCTTDTFDPDTGCVHVRLEQCSFPE